jgi:hypothetical protein
VFSISIGQYITLGVDVLTENFHNLQSQALSVMRTSKIHACFQDSSMHFTLSRMPGDSFRSQKDGEKGKNSAHMHGMISSTECLQVLNLSTSVLYIQFEKLESKAANYGSLTFMVEIYQSILIILQMKNTASNAGYSKISLLCMSGQAVLDAIICVAHLLICAAVPSVFFFHFIWISISSLVLFSVFEMKIAINILQARHATDDWAALRNRMTSFQSKFYFTLFAIMILIFILQSHPAIILFILYSFWVPQIIHSVKTVLYQL